jgi:hypothetical protein
VTVPMAYIYCICEPFCCTNLTFKISRSRESSNNNVCLSFNRAMNSSTRTFRFFFGGMSACQEREEKAFANRIYQPERSAVVEKYLREIVGKIQKWVENIQFLSYFLPRNNQKSSLSELRYNVNFEQFHCCFTQKFSWDRNSS